MELLWVQQDVWRYHPFGCLPLALTLQQLPFLLSMYCNHSSLQRGFPVAAAALTLLPSSEPLMGWAFPHAMHVGA